MQKKLLIVGQKNYNTPMTNQERLALLANRPFQYLPESGELRSFSIMSIEEVKDDSVTVKVHDLDNYKKGVFKTLKFSGILTKEFLG